MSSAPSDQFRHWPPTSLATGSLIEGGKIRINIYFTPLLFKQIRAEAKRRGWSFAKMVRHLCEASIEGIE